jgi:hypothetical protein
MRVNTARTAALAAIALVGGIALAGCSTPAPQSPVDSSDDPVTPSAPVPAWYGDSFDDDGCPVPGDGADIVRTADPSAFLGADLPDGWCLYEGVDYTTYFALPATEVEDPGSEARSALEPAGWAFDAADDDSPQWSWITAYPEASAADFSDGNVDGAIFVTPAITGGDIETYSLWFEPLTSAFGQWSEDDYVAVVGFW